MRSRRWPTIRNAYLVVPRVLAATMMFPVVTAFAMAVGVTSGWLTSVNLLDLSTPEFLKGLKQFYQFKDIWFGLVKSASFGAAVALMGCLRGSSEGGAAGRRAHPPPAPWCSAARRSWCSTRSGRWSSCEDADAGGLRLMLRLDAAQVLRPPRSRSSRGFSLEVPDGQNTVIIGHSGSGKSVTLKLIVGLLEPDAGQVEVDGEIVQEMDRERAGRAARAGSDTCSSSRPSSTR